jgi:ABC-type Fe3+/spermidine/putrescine transport system ATPase subunit
MTDSDIVELAGVTKRFGRTVAVDDVSFAVKRGEFCTLLGPSGCGKTTLLRTIAGFEFPDEGDVRISGRSCLDQPAHRRNLAMVFQGYALFPHRTVLQNVLFGLRMRKMGSPAEIAGWARTALGMVGLDGFEDRHPQQLSGGQQQRVALARALVLKPEVLLLDEPLGALDLKLRKAMRYELKRLQRTTGITTIYVTHDQEEAMSMSDKVVVLNRGRIEQIGRPEEIYSAPRSAFVGDFIGESNLIRATVIEVLPAGRLRVRIDGLAATGVARMADGANLASQGDAVMLLVRAERVRLADHPVGEGDWFAGEVVECSFLGATTRLYVKAAGSERIVIADIAGAPPAWAVQSATIHFGWAPNDGLAYAFGDAPDVPGDRLP